MASHTHITYTDTHTHTQPFYGSLDLFGITQVSRYQKKHSSSHSIVVINRPFSFIHLTWSMASSLLNLRAWYTEQRVIFLGHVVVFSPAARITAFLLPGLCNNKYPPSCAIAKMSARCTISDNMHMVWS